MSTQNDDSFRADVFCTAVLFILTVCVMGARMHYDIGELQKQVDTLQFRIGVLENGQSISLQPSE